MGDSMPTDDQPAAAARPAPPPEAPLREWTAYILEQQAGACRILGSSLYASLLTQAAADVRRAGPVWGVLEPHATRDTGAALGLRFMAAVHRVVLERRAPQLAVHFPSVGGTADPGGAWDALLEVAVGQRDRLQALTGQPCQTNEVGRCAALLVGFLTAARRSGLPLRMLELGASAGLNLRWDRYSYADTGGGPTWGDISSPVALRGEWDVPSDLVATQVQVVERAGCDPRPVDPTTDEGRLALTASVWSDQRARFERLRGALQLAAEQPAEVAKARAIDWLPPRLAQTTPGVTTIVYHSVVMQYLDPAEREQVVAELARAGDTATPDAPLFWVRMEPERPMRAMSVRLTAWPGGDEELLATAGAHGDPVRWRGHG